MSENSNQKPNQVSVVPPMPTYADYSNEGRLKRKIKEEPLVPIGMAGFFAIVAYNAYNIIRRKKSTLPLQLRIIHTRMYAQGFVVSLLACGMIYSSGKHYYENYVKPKQQDNDGQQNRDV